MNAYDKLEKVKRELINYNSELMGYMHDETTDISIKKVQARILNMLREVE